MPTFASGRIGYPPVESESLGDIKPHELIPYIKSTLQQQCNLEITVKHITVNTRLNITPIPLELFLQQPNIVAAHRFAISTVADSKRIEPAEFKDSNSLSQDENLELLLKEQVKGKKPAGDAMQNILDHHIAQHPQSEGDQNTISAEKKSHDAAARLLDLEEVSKANNSRPGEDLAPHHSR
jgi:hypothetical protein